MASLRAAHGGMSAGIIAAPIQTTQQSAAGEHELERYARTLTPSIRDDGRAKVLKGETTIEEVLRVTRED